MDLPLWAFVSIGFERAAEGQLLAVSQQMKLEFSLSAAGSWEGRLPLWQQAGLMKLHVCVEMRDSLQKSHGSRLK